MKASYSLVAEDILSFFNSSSRSENDAANKKRENILVMVYEPPIEFTEHPEVGQYWRLVQKEWKDYIHKIGKITGIVFFTSILITGKGGRSCHHDFVFTYYNRDQCLGSRNIEFKYEATTIDHLPQFLSLQAKYPLFQVTFDEFWYDQWLAKYIACDAEIRQDKPSRETYLKCVTNTKYTIHPFIAEIKQRELFFQTEKNHVVNEGITDYLTKYGHTLNLDAFSKKVKETQMDKIYLLWSGGTFHLDKLQEEEISGMVFHSIKNGNVLVVKAGNTIYGLLLRWRNHKGILNPAWQISMKRMMR